MGSQVMAICECGVHKKILIGGGKLTFKFQCYFPCLCEDCKDVVQVNLKFGLPRCPTCDGNNVIPYNNQKLIGSVGDREVVNWSGQRLTNGNYKCPKCNKPTLTFSRSFFMWD